VDQLAERWALRQGLPIKIFRPEYNKRIAPWTRSRWQLRAPLERNKRMAEYSDALVAVWDGRSRGTAHIIEYMRSLKRPVFLREVK
jgi:hypothetical protein